MNLCIINFSHRDYKKSIYLPVAYIGHWNVLTSVLLHGFKLDCSCICVCFCSCFCLNCICICITCICICICICCGENEHPDAPGWVEIHRLRFGHSAPLPLEARPLSLAGTPARGGRGRNFCNCSCSSSGKRGPQRAFISRYFGFCEENWKCIQKQSGIVCRSGKPSWIASAVLLSRDMWAKVWLTT